MSKKVTVPRDVAEAIEYVRITLDWDDRTIIRRVVDRQSYCTKWYKKRMANIDLFTLIDAVRYGYKIEEGAQ